MTFEILPDAIRVYGVEVHTRIMDMSSPYMERMDHQAILSNLTLTSDDEYVVIFPGCGDAKSETLFLRKLVQQCKVRTAIFLHQCQVEIGTPLGMSNSVPTI